MTQKEVERLKTLVKKARTAANEKFFKEVEKNNPITAGGAYSLYSDLVNLQTKFDLTIFDDYLLDKPKRKTINQRRADYAIMRALNEKIKSLH